MKTILALVVFALAGCATAEQGPTLTVSSVYDAPGKTKQEICNTARDWAAVTFKDSKAVIEVFDAERGKLIGKGNMTLYGYASTPFRVGFTMTVDCRDGKMRASFDNYMLHYQGMTSQLREDSMNNLQTKARTETNTMAQNLAAQVVKGDAW